MRIVVLDEFGMTQEDLARLEAKGEVRVFHDQPATPDEIVARAAGADVVLDGWSAMDAWVLGRLPGLRLIAVASTGVDVVDVEAASASGVMVCHVPAYATQAVAELAVALMFAVVRRVAEADRDVRRTLHADWQAFKGAELGGKTLGVVGTGAIGRRVAQLGRCLCMEVLGHDVVRHDAFARELPLTYVPLPELFARSDVVTLHLPLLPGTRGLVDRSLLEVMRNTAVVINTARAQLVDQDDLLEALRAGCIAGAGLDVVDLHTESGARLVTSPNVVCTPHIGFNTREAAARLTAMTTENVVRFLDGRPHNVVNPDVVAACGPAG